MSIVINNLPEMREMPFSSSLHDTERLEQDVLKIITKKNLSERLHPFFIISTYINENKKSPSLTSAFEIASNWEMITKTFMYTTFRSLSKFSEQLEFCDGISADDVLTIFQTAINVISDDINNNHPAFSNVAPKGAGGIHYKWWHDEIVLPIAKKLNIDSCEIKLSHNVDALIQGMRRLANKPFGFAIQLRIVEDIALHIAVAFQCIFNNLFHKGEKVFSDRRSLAWITSHIKAEVSHHNQVSNTESGMSCIATTLHEQKKFLEMTEWYAGLWEKALNDLHQFLNIENP